MRGYRQGGLAMCVVLGLLACTAALTMGASFRDVPPTIGAYTLRGGEWQIGVGMGFLFLPMSYDASVSVAYGITSWFMAGIAVSHGVQPGPPPAYMSYDFSAKLRLPLGSALDLGLPLGAWFYDEGYGIAAGGLGSGAVLSLKMGAGLTVHGGAAVGTVRAKGWYFQPYIIADFDLLPNLKLVGEVGLLPVSVAVGAWLRVLDFMDLKLALAPLALSFTGGLYLRF
ncbi:MAG: hypothetical protein ACP5LK_07330 [Candidatus Bipolaricaulaceae bacterium]